IGPWQREAHGYEGIWLDLFDGGRYAVDPGDEALLEHAAAFLAAPEVVAPAVPGRDAPPGARQRSAVGAECRLVANLVGEYRVERRALAAQLGQQVAPEGCVRLDALPRQIGDVGPVRAGLVRFVQQFGVLANGRWRIRGENDEHSVRLGAAQEVG